MSWFQNCSLLDYVFIGFSLFLVIRGFFTGCSGQIGSLAGMVVSTILLFSGRSFVAAKLCEYTSFQESSVPFQIILLVLMTVTCISIWLLCRHLVSKMLRTAIPQPMNSILGGIVGAVEVMLLISILCAMGMFSSEKRQEMKEKSFLQEHSSLIDSISPWVEPFMKKSPCTKTGETPRGQDMNSNARRSRYER